MQEELVIDDGPLDFADLARSGKNAWWRYVLSFVGFLFVGLVIFLGVYFAVWAVLGTDPATLITLKSFDFSTVEGIRTSMAMFVFFMASIFVFLISARIIFPLLHGRPWRTFLTAHDRFRYGHFFQSFFALTLVFVVATAGQLIFFPDTISYRLQLEAFLIFLPVVLALTFLQIMAEEVLVRGYLLQLIGLITPVYLIRLLAPGLIFGALHFWNPEVLASGGVAIGIFMIAGTYMTFLVLRSNGLEQAAGVHFANNIFVFLVLGNAADQFDTPTVFFDPSTTIDNIDLLVSAGVFALHFIILTAWERRNATN